MNEARYKFCSACNGLLGRDCFNEQDCLMISKSIEQDVREEEGSSALENYLSNQEYIRQLCSNAIS